MFRSFKPHAKCARDSAMRDRDKKQKTKRERRQNQRQQQDTGEGERERERDVGASRRQKKRWASPRGSFIRLGICTLVRTCTGSGLHSRFVGVLVQKVGRLKEETNHHPTTRTEYRLHSVGPRERRPGCMSTMRMRGPEDVPFSH